MEGFEAAQAAVVDPATPTATLTDIANRFPQLRGHVAQHPNVDPGLREWLASQETQHGQAQRREPGAARGADSRSARTGGGLRLLLGAGIGVVVTVLVVGALVLTGVLGFGGRDSSSLAQGPGYSTPEEAATAYLEALRDGDIDGMLEPYAVESFVEQCDNAAMLRRVRATFMGALATGCPFPDDQALGADANLAARKSAVTGFATQHLMVHAAPTMFNDGQARSFREDSEIDAYLQQVADEFANSPFTSMSDIAVQDPASMSDAYAAEQNQQTIAQQIAGYGLTTENYRDVAITFTARGQQWLFAPAVGRYGDRWYLVAPSGNLAALLGLPSQSQGLSPYEG